MRSVDWVLGASWVGAGTLLAVLIVCSPVETVDWPLGVAATQRDLSTIVAAGYNPGASAIPGSVPCQGVFYAASTCHGIVNGNCVGVGGPAWATDRTCSGPNPTACQGALVPYYASVIPFYCCQVNLATCYNVIDIFPPYPVVACRTAAPYGDLWVGSVNMCGGDYTPIPEG
jgi:hypothetical protein